MKRFINPLCLFLFLLTIPLLFLSCEEGEKKCQKDAVTRDQLTDSFWDAGINHGTVNPDGSVSYSYKYAFLEVCTHSSISVGATVSLKENGLLVHADLRMFDVYDNPILGWTSMPQISQTVFEYVETGIRAEPKEKETIIWVEIRITTPITNWEIEQIHANMANDLKKVEVVLTHYKPDWS